MGTSFSKSKTCRTLTERGSILYTLMILIASWGLIAAGLAAGLNWHHRTLQLALKDRQSLAVALSAFAILEYSPSLALSVSEPVTKTWLMSHLSLLGDVELTENQILYAAKTPSAFYIVAIVEDQYTTTAKLPYSVAPATSTTPARTRILRMELL